MASNSVNAPRATTITSALIIGGCGFLGRHLTVDLAERGCPAVTVFDVRAPANVATALPRGTRVVVGDLEQDRALLLGAMRGVDVVFHCASPPYHLNDGALFHRVNVDGTRLVVDACREAGVGKLVLTSSCSVVYAGTDLCNADEQTPTPTTFLDYYTETKMLQEKIVVEANDGRELYTVAVRPHGIFGPFDHTCSEILAKARQGKMKFVIGDGTNIVDFTHVRNVTWGHILAAEHLGKSGCANGQVYNITNDEPIQFWVFIAVLMSKFDMDAPHIHLPYWLLYGVAWFLERVVRLLIPAYQPFLSPFKVALAGTHHYYSCEKAKRDLGFRPVVSLADGIDDAVHYFKSLENTK